jgi:hypothetical protein
LGIQRSEGLVPSPLSVAILDISAQGGVVPMLTNILVVSGCDVGMSVCVCAAMAADDVKTINSEAKLPQNPF